MNTDIKSGHTDEQDSAAAHDSRLPPIVEAHADNDPKAALGHAKNADPDHRKSYRRSWRSASPLTKLQLCLTAIIAAATVLYCLFSGWTLHEIHSGARDTKAVAQAAQTSANAAEQQVKAMQGQLSAMQDQANTLRETLRIGQQSETALVTVGGVTAGELKTGQIPEVTVMFVNTGKTVANNLSIGGGANFSIKIHPLPIPRDATTAQIRASEGSITSLAPQGTLDIVMPYSQPFNEEIIRAYDGKTFKWYIWGVVRYEDILGKKRWTNFCYVHRFGTLQFTACGQHNDAH